MSEKCGAIGALTVGGRVVGQVTCELDAGHELGLPPSNIAGVYLSSVPGTPHAMTLTWTPEIDGPDLELFDPAEHFDTDVPFEPPAGAATNPRPRCEARGWGRQCRYESGHDGPHDVDLDELVALPESWDYDGRHYERRDDGTVREVPHP